MSLSENFNHACTVKRTPKKRPAPFSIRFIESERAYIEKMADGGSMSAYIRDAALSKHARKRNRPKVDQEKLAFVLAAFGQSRLS